jgi:4-hydroxybenzoate polyprenyltransferase
MVHCDGPTNTITIAMVQQIQLRSTEMKRRLNALGSFVLLLLTVGRVHGFSARLSRPWEPAIEVQVKSRKGLFYMSKKLASRARVTAPKSSSSACAAKSNSEGNESPRDDDGSEAKKPENSSPFSTSRLSLATSLEDTRQDWAADNSRRVNGAVYERAPGVWQNLGPLFQLTRPANFPGVVLLHLLGGYLALKHTGQSHLFVTTMIQAPFMWIVLGALLLTSSTSMLVNDYYDTKLGRDTDKKNSPLVTGKLNLSIVRTFLNYLYAAALLCVAFVPGVPARLSVVVALMLTYWYTRHLKPITWIKNVMCATLIALSPFTSGSAALKVASEVGTGPWGGMRVLMVPSLWRLVAMLFFGVSGREVMMDIVDQKDDSLNRVRTIPVKYGRNFASGVAMVCYLVGALWVLGGPLFELVGQLAGQTVSHPTLQAILMTNAGGMSRRLLFASLGTFMLARRGIQVFRTKGEDLKTLDRTIDEAQLAMVLCLVSFF